jgi:phosphatidylinositol alpha-mannosyltransferase
MKIAIVCPYPLDSTGGVQRHILDFYEILKERGYYVKLVSPSKNFIHPDHIRVGTVYKIKGNGSTSWYPRTRITKFKAELPEVFDIIHIHEPFFFPPFYYGYRIQLNNTSRYLAHLHAYSTIYDYWDGTIKPVMEKIMKDFESIAASSTVSASHYEFVKKNIDIVPNGVDTKRHNPDIPKATEYLDGKKNLFFIGRFDERKGLRYLLEAWPVLCSEFGDNIRLIIAGGGRSDEEVGIKEIVETLPFKENIVFEGRVSEERKAQLYATADLFCAPAVAGESFGMVLTESMASGTPVVCFGNPGYLCVMKEKAQDCVARVYDILELSHKIITILKDESLQKELIEWGLDEVRKKYDWEVVADQVIKIYEKMMEKPPHERNFLPIDPIFETLLVTSAIKDNLRFNKWINFPA